MEKMKSWVKGKSSKKHQEKKNKEANGVRVPQNGNDVGATADLAAKAKLGQYDNPGIVQEDVTTDLQPSIQKQAGASAECELPQCQQGGTSKVDGVDWDKIYPSLPKPPQDSNVAHHQVPITANQASPGGEFTRELPNQSDTGGAAAAQQGNHMVDKLKNAYSPSNCQPRVDSANGESSRMDNTIQETANSLDMLKLNPTAPPLQQENLTPQSDARSSSEVPHERNEDLHSREEVRVSNEQGRLEGLKEADRDEGLEVVDGNEELQEAGGDEGLEVEDGNERLEVEDGEEGLQVEHRNEVQQGVDGEEAEAEENGQQVHAQEEVAPSEEPLVSGLQENDNIMEKISLMLYPRNSVIKNWEGLAHELHAPPSIRAQCKRITHHSQTRVLFETLSSSHDTEDLTVKKLIEVLSTLKRRDVVDLLKKKFPEAIDRERKVTEKMTSDEELMEELETLLDKESKVVKNWYYIGLKLGLSKEALQEIKDGNNHNGVPALFQYIYATFPALTVEKFKKIMNDIDRKDIVDQLAGVCPGAIKTSIPLHSDKLRSICYLLNKNSCGTVKDWKHLARELNIDYHKYKNFDKETQESPTKVLLEWALTENPNMTVTDLCELFKKIRRYDVIEEIEKFYERSFIQS